MQQREEEALYRRWEHRLGVVCARVAPRCPSAPLFKNPFSIGGFSVVFGLVVLALCALSAVKYASTAHPS